MLCINHLLIYVVTLQYTTSVAIVGCVGEYLTGVETSEQMQGLQASSYLAAGGNQVHSVAWCVITRVDFGAYVDVTTAQALGYRVTFFGQPNAYGPAK